MSIDGIDPLTDGRRRVHVVAEALARLGLDRGRIDDVIEFTGERVISNDSEEERLASMTFERAAARSRQALVKAWREACDKVRGSGKVGAARLQELSLPGIPVTPAVLADLGILDESDRMLMIFKLASLKGFLESGRHFRQVIAYLDLCIKDPLLTSAYRRILIDKKEYVMQSMVRAEMDRGSDGEYKALFASLAIAADEARARLLRRTREGSPAVAGSRAFMLGL
jgi:hypothetical protein